MHFSRPAAVATLASLAAAAPSLVKRTSASFTFGDWTGSTSSFSEGTGTYVKSYDTYRYESGVKCWTDLWYVDQTPQAEGWVQSDVTVDCATTENCASGQVNATQQCSDWSISESVSFDFTVAKDIFGVSGGISATEGGSQCTTATSTTTCTWNDQQCHALWTSNTLIIDQGYILRRCNSGSGDYTAWSKDLNFTTPSTQTRLGCAAFCNDTYPSAVPSPLPVST